MWLDVELELCVVGQPIASVRAVCANTKRLAIAKAGNQQITIRHSGKMDSKLQYARAYLSQWDQSFTLFREGARELLKGYTPEQAKEYIERLFPTPKLDQGERVRGNHARMVSQIRAAYYERSNRLDSIKGTWWSLYNCVSHFVDHGNPGRQAKDITARRENRFLSVTKGKGADTKDEAFKLALEMAV